MAHPESELIYAGFWRRVGAYFLDTVLIAVLSFALLLMAYGLSYMDDPNAYWGPMQALISYGLPPALILSFWIQKSKTPGKMAVAATIVDAQTGAKPSTKQFVIRYVSYIVSALPLCLGFLWIVFDSRKQGWHDKLAGTVVVQRKAGSSEPVRFDTPMAGPAA